MQQNNFPHHPPHKTFGRQLKTMRQHVQESLGETSGAVEIEVEQLDRFERGAELPSEDILMLLLSHFGVPDDEAVQLWELAGYDRRSHRGRSEAGGHDDEAEQPFVGDAAPPLRPGQSHIMLLALDQRVLYTNGAEIVADAAGVVLNFSQNEPGNQNQYVVGRMGMSYVQAEQLMHALQRTLLHKQYMSGPKQLPPETGQATN